MIHDNFKTVFCNKQLVHSPHELILLVQYVNHDYVLYQEFVKGQLEYHRPLLFIKEVQLVSRLSLVSQFKYTVADGELVEHGNRQMKIGLFNKTHRYNSTDCCAKLKQLILAYSTVKII